MGHLLSDNNGGNCGVRSCFLQELVVLCTGSGFADAILRVCH